MNYIFFYKFPLIVFLFWTGGYIKDLKKLLDQIFASLHLNKFNIKYLINLCYLIILFSNIAI